MPTFSLQNNLALKLNNFFSFQVFLGRSFTLGNISGEQTIKALLQFGIVVGVCLMVGIGFMTMVWVEILCDRFVDEYRLVKRRKLD